MRWLFLACLAPILLCMAPHDLHAEPIVGIVTNKTTDKPSAGDDVTLLKLSQGMQDLTHTVTDAKGRFSLDVPAEGLHMIRVTHDKANYFRPIQPGTQSIEVEVYTAAAKVAGVAQEADVMRIESDPSGSGLRIVEHFFIKNDSKPPETQMSDSPFELWLPAGAVVEGSAAMAPGGMAVQSPLVPLAEPTHFSMIFPLRPGETQFQVTYKLPYSGSLTFTPHIAIPTGTVAVMLPKSIAFKPGPSTSYIPATEETSAQTFIARNVEPSQPLSFTLSGTGSLPRDSQAGQTDSPSSTQSSTQTPAEASAAMRSDTGAGKGLGNPLDSDGDLEPWAKYKWWIIGGIGLILAIGAGFLLRGPSTTFEEAGSSTPDMLAISAPGTSVLDALRNELFALEVDRIHAVITEEEYAAQRAAFETVLRRTLNRMDGPIPPSSSSEGIPIVPE
jgi:hypothetical protein